MGMIYNMLQALHQQYPALLGSPCFEGCTCSLSIEVQKKYGWKCMCFILGICLPDMPLKRETLQCLVLLKCVNVQLCLTRSLRQKIEKGVALRKCVISAAMSKEKVLVIPTVFGKSPALLRLFAPLLPWLCCSFPSTILGRRETLCLAQQEILCLLHLSFFLIDLPK